MSARHNNASPSAYGNGLVWKGNELVPAPKPACAPHGEPPWSGEPKQLDFSKIDEALGWTEPEERQNSPLPDFAQQAELFRRILEWLADAKTLIGMALRACILIWVGAPGVLPDRTLRGLAERLGVTPALLSQYAKKLREELCGGRHCGANARSDTGRENMRQAALKRSVKAAADTAATGEAAPAAESGSAEPGAGTITRAE